MYPVINIFGFDIQTYSILAAIGFIVTVSVAVYISKRRSIAPDKSLTASLVAGLGILLGGHVLFAVTNIQSIIHIIRTEGFLLSSLMPYISGMVFYGGLFGAIIAIFIFCSANKDVSRSDVFDVFAVSIPLFHIFGRVGCFMAGCCYGIESNLGFATYLNTAPAHYGISRFPVALVEAFVNLLIFVLLINIYKKKRFSGKLIFIYLLIYAVSRFVLEFFRGDDIRGFVLGFSTSQFISLLILAFLLIYSIVLFVKKSHRTK